MVYFLGDYRKRRRFLGRLFCKLPYWLFYGKKENIPMESFLVIDTGPDLRKRKSLSNPSTPKKTNFDGRNHQLTPSIETPRKDKKIKNVHETTKVLQTESDEGDNLICEKNLEKKEPEIITKKKYIDAEDAALLQALENLEKKKSEEINKQKDIDDVVLKSLENLEKKKDVDELLKSFEEYEFEEVESRAKRKVRYSMAIVLEELKSKRENDNCEDSKQNSEKKDDEDKPNNEEISEGDDDEWLKIVENEDAETKATRKIRHSMARVLNEIKTVKLKQVFPKSPGGTPMKLKRAKTPDSLKILKHRFAVMHSPMENSNSSIDCSPIN